MSNVEMNPQEGIKKRNVDELAGRAVQLIGLVMGVAAAGTVATIAALCMWDETYEFMRLRNPTLPVDGGSVSAVHPEFDRIGLTSARSKLDR